MKDLLTFVGEHPLVTFVVVSGYAIVAGLTWEWVMGIGPVYGLSKRPWKKTP